MRPLLVLAALLGAPLALAAADLPPDTPVIVDGAVQVTAGDIEGYMLRVPENKRAEVRASYDRVLSIADGLFLARSLAAKARAAGLDKDVVLQRRLEQAQDSVLADAYVQHMEKNAPKPNLEARARELYLADQAKYVTIEQVHVEHILIGLNGRTREMAEERAKKVYQEAVSGKEDFLALAARLSDDPDKKRNGGDMGYNSTGAFVEPLAKRIATMSRKGEISEPVESHFGFHIVRFIDRKKPEPIKYDEVKQSIVAAERDRLAKKRQEELIMAVRSSPTATIHRDKVEALVTPLGDLLPKAAAAAAEASKAK